jgi:hypothetical protein
MEWARNTSEKDGCMSRSNTQHEVPMNIYLKMHHHVSKIRPHLVRVSLMKNVSQRMETSTSIMLSYGMTRIPMHSDTPTTSNSFQSKIWIVVVGNKLIRSYHMPTCLTG